MDYRTCIALTLVSLAGLVLAACSGGSTPSGTGAPDLLPVPQISSFNPPRFSFCVRDEDNFYITVKNQGGGSAAQSVTVIDFGSTGGAFDIVTSPLNPGDSVVLTQPIPAACFNPDCSFTILVNQNNVVDEGGADGNNTAAGQCIG